MLLLFLKQLPYSLRSLLPQELKQKKKPWRFKDILNIAKLVFHNTNVGMCLKPQWNYLFNWCGVVWWWFMFFQSQALPNLFMIHELPCPLWPQNSPTSIHSPAHRWKRHALSIGLHHIKPSPGPAIAVVVLSMQTALWTFADWALLCWVIRLFRLVINCQVYWVVVQHGVGCQDGAVWLHAAHSIKKFKSFVLRHNILSEQSIDFVEFSLSMTLLCDQSKGTVTHAWNEGIVQIQIFTSYGVQLCWALMQILPWQVRVTHPILC